MNYRDIKPFTKSGSYEVNVGLEFLETTIKDYEEEKKYEIHSYKFLELIGRN